MAGADSTAIGGGRQEGAARRAPTVACGLEWTLFVTTRAACLSTSSLHNFRRLRICYERSAEIHTALLVLACSILCWRRLKSL